MKKYLLIFLLIILVGCSDNNQVKCYKNYYEEDSSYEEVIKATIDNDKVTKLDATLTFSSKEKTEIYCNALKQYTKYHNLDIKYNCSGKKIEIENYEKYDKEYNDIIGYSKQELIDFYTAFQYACK